MKVRRVTLDVERLEERAVPASFGFAWPDAGHLTISFAPDGTSTGSQQSQLFQKLGSQYSTSAWETAILRAFQTWAVAANINVGLVPDGGQALGAPGAFQGDSRFGDIRIAGGSLSSNLVALGTPFDPTVGTWSGDVVFNNAYNFSIGTGTPYDLFTVALHEAGHSFGLPDNNDPTSVMYNQYNGADTQLSPGDVAAIQALYGPRSPDVFGWWGNGNHTFSTAPWLNISDSIWSYKSVSIAADITNPGEADYYKFNNPGSNAGAGVTIQVQTAGVSLLEPQVTVYDQNQQVVATSAASSPLTGMVSVRLTNVSANALYTVKVTGATNDVFGQGAYHLLVQPDSAGSNSPNLIGYPNSALSDYLTDTVFAGAKHLAQNNTAANNHFDYTYHDGLSSSTAVDYYRVQSPQPASGSTNVMTAVVWAQQAGGLNPTVNVYDQRGNPVAAQVMLNENGAYDVQVPSTVATAYYYVAVSAADPSNSRNAGNFFLGVDFQTPLVQQQQFAQLTLTNNAKQAGRALTVTSTQGFHFALSGSNVSSSAATGVRMTIYDSTGKVAYTLVALNGQTRTGSLLLSAGTYTIRFAAATQDGSPLPNMLINLAGLSGFGGDLGPQLVGSGGGGSGPPPGPVYTITDPGGYTFLASTDPYSTPF